MVSHTHIASRTDRDEVVNCCGTALAIGDVVTALKVKDRNRILTPDHFALCPKNLARFRNPDLFAKSFWYLH